jgi:uncharacterized protein
VARCLTFGGHFGRTLHDPSMPPRCDLTKEAYMTGSQQQTTINHFHEKLFKLEGLMNTAAGKAVALKRSEFMRHFVDRFYLEWDASDVP